MVLILCLSTQFFILSKILASITSKGPELTKWQAKFRSWNKLNKLELTNITPQELQKKYPEYPELMKDLEEVNELLIQYARELKRIVDK